MNVRNVIFPSCHRSRVFRHILRLLRRCHCFLSLLLLILYDVADVVVADVVVADVVVADVVADVVVADVVLY